MGRPAVDEGARQSAFPEHAPVAPALVLTGVTRDHGGRPVWGPVDLFLAPGTLTVVTGPNGSGKSTLLRLAAGLLRPSTGVRACAGTALYVHGGAGLRMAQSVADAVATTAALAGRAARAGDAVDLLGLGPLAGRRVGSLSAGERVRAALAAAVACAPALLCLDEPTAALDAAGLQVLDTVLDALQDGGTAVLLATHQADAVRSPADAHLSVGGCRVVLR